MSPASAYRKRLAQASLFRIGAPGRKFGHESTILHSLRSLKICRSRPCLARFQHRSDFRFLTQDAQACYLRNRSPLVNIIGAKRTIILTSGDPAHLPAQRGPGRWVRFLPGAKQQRRRHFRVGAGCLCSRQESNLHYRLRKLASYPLNDGSE